MIKSVKIFVFTMALFIISNSSFSEQKTEVRQRDVDIITSYYFKERSKEITFNKGTRVIETFTVISDNDIGFSYTVMLPEVMKDKKNWKVSATMMTLVKDSIVQRNNFKVNVELLTDIGTGNKFTGINMYFWAPGSQQNTFYFQFEYIGEETEITIPWKFDLYIGKELENKTEINKFYGKPIKYVINVNEFR